ncbi:hypothetical protein OEA41_003451 [Lepraria neglecta]|uniref:GPI inositol-deacylase winged helix domain-containing protein n=1 Tax=Lepraria neglecta TaxID=209136 RepID=A0AAD9Z7S5_9LECA|nr:hypothetical protein OEA41_003451 [Lepraria neglecta]
MHILITCRNGTADVEQKLDKHVRLEVRSNEDDIRKYIKSRLDAQDNISESNNDSPGFDEMIIEAILPRLEGMFLLARLYIDILGDLPTQRDVREALKSLPERREETYLQAWNRVNAQMARKRELGKNILLWIVNAQRPLRLVELQHALAIREDDDELDTTGFVNTSTVTSFCAGLVMADGKRNILSLVLSTTQEFFDSRKDDLFPTAHEMIALTFMTYLRIQSFRDEGALFDPTLFDYRWKRHQLLGYAAVY